MATMRPDEEGPNGSRDPMAKAVRVLTWMVDSPDTSWGVRELAQALGLVPSTAHRLLALLQRNGLVTYEAATRTYALDLEFLRIARLAAAKLPVPEVATEYLRRLVDTVDETGVLGLYDSVRQMMLYHTVLESSHHVRYVVEAGRWYPITTGASGLAILAFLPDGERRSLLSRPLPALTESTITNPIALEQTLDTIRRQGYAVTHGQRIPGAVGIAAPIFAGDSVIGDVILSVPQQRFDPGSEGHLTRQVLDCACSITADVNGVVATRT